MQLLLVGLEETDLKIYVGGRNKRANQYTYMKKWQLSRVKKDKWRISKDNICESRSEFCKLKTKATHSLHRQGDM
jgi:hypothetical protein